MPQPIDPQTEIGRATAAERIQQIADRVSLAAQARAAAEMANARASAETQVHQAMRKNDEVDRELRRRTPFSGRRKRQGGGQEAPEDTRTRHFYNAAEKEVVADDDSAHRLDIEI
ncbi:MAG: hypothetical protein JNK74_19315 [Candidatus Hydrogenedentes bacterium]|nr:hypothetical protein [Candidatus Hydrogenedentota bacterium]